MFQKSDIAPHRCPSCGRNAYLGFCVPARCVNPGCKFFDEQLCDEFAKEFLKPQGSSPLPAYEDAEDTTPGYSTASALKQALDDMRKAVWNVPTPFYLLPDEDDDSDTSLD